jgi:hypothetical protein
MREEPLQEIKEGSICAEVGVWRGDYSVRILKKNPRSLHLIDPWIHQDYKNRWYSIEQKKMDGIFREVVEKFKDDKRVTIHQNFSTDVDFPTEYFDWVYIDGNHDYNAVLKDLCFYLPLMKKGGILCGDDYGITPQGQEGAPGPGPAVDKFIEQNNLKLEIYNRQFIIRI